MSNVNRAIGVVFLVMFAAGCAKRQVAPAPAPPPELPPAASTAKPTPPPPAPPPAPATTTRVEDNRPVAAPVGEDRVTDGPLEQLSALLKPAFFVLDSSELDDAGRAVVSANADLLRKNRTWMVTIEGHADERGTAEYNLALGERRANAAKAYLVSLGIEASRLRTVSYGKEFPFEPGHDESAWSKNRRAHFQITAK